jgi:hypothetical protein
MVRAPAGLHGDDAAWLLGKEGENFLSGKLLAESHAAVGEGAVRLEGALCKVETDDASVMGRFSSSPSEQHLVARIMLLSVVSTKGRHTMPSDPKPAGQSKSRDLP